MTTRLRLPTPPPYAGPHRCGSCLGAGITGATFTMPLPQVNVGGVLDPDGTVLVVDEICQECQGCGRARHTDGCRWDQHADPEQVGFDPWDRDDGEEIWPTADSCASCRGTPQPQPQPYRMSSRTLGRLIQAGVVLALLAAALTWYLVHQRQAADRARQDCERRNRVGALVNAEQGNPPSWFRPEDCR